MSATITSPNNRAVKFRGKGEREMASTEKPMMGGGLPKPSGVKRQPGPKYGKRMRKRARSAAKRGLISEAAMKKHMGEGY